MKTSRLVLASRKLTTTLGACVLALGLAACDGGSGDGSSSGSAGSESGSTSATDTGEPEPMPTGATCDPANTLTYENFGDQFFTDYCRLCHKSTVIGDMARYGAPKDVNYDTLAQIKAKTDEIDAQAGAAGDIVNTLMPGSPKYELLGLYIPTLTERENLAAWLACGAP